MSFHKSVGWIWIRFLMPLRLFRRFRSLRLAFFDCLIIAGREAALAEFDHDLVELAGEVEWHLGLVILDDRRAGVFADVQRLVRRNAEGDGSLNPALR